MSNISTSPRRLQARDEVGEWKSRATRTPGRTRAMRTHQGIFAIPGRLRACSISSPRVPRRASTAGARSRGRASPAPPSVPDDVGHVSLTREGVSRERCPSPGPLRCTAARTRTLSGARGAPGEREIVARWGMTAGSLVLRRVLAQPIELAEEALETRRQGHQR